MTEKSDETPDTPEWVKDVIDVTDDTALVVIESDEAEDHSLLMSRRYIFDERK